MGYFAEIKNNKVIRVIIAEQDYIDTLEGQWVETFTDGSQRGKYAGIDDDWDSDNNRFKPKKLYDSWIWNEQEKRYDPPSAMPLDSQLYKWNENAKRWEV